MKPWLSIVGIGEDGWDGLNASGRHAIQSAEHIIGSKRTLAMLPATSGQRLEWPQPFSQIVEDVKPMRGQATVMLATGDPSNYGSARKILEVISKDEVTIIPGLSAFSLAGARMGWSLPDCDCFTIHGRPASNLEVFIQPDTKLLLLTQDETSVSEVCRRLVARGFEKSHVTVFENMGGPKERSTSFAANNPPAMDWSPLNTLAIRCVASDNAKIWPRVPGLPDEAFEHDGQITKREIRAATLAALAPAPNKVLWDIGAGSGSVSIEWCRSAREARAYAIEPNADRQKMIAKNADQLGAARMFIFNGSAPAAYPGLPPPDAVFIGGGLDGDDVFEGAWSKLVQGGNLVANTVTLEGERRLIDLQEQHGGEIVRMDVSTLTKIGDMRALRPRMSVLQWRVMK